MFVSQVARGYFGQRALVCLSPCHVYTTVVFTSDPRFASVRKLVEAVLGSVDDASQNRVDTICIYNKIDDPTLFFMFQSGST